MHNVISHILRRLAVTQNCCHSVITAATAANCVRVCRRITVVLYCWLPWFAPRLRLETFQCIVPSFAFAHCLPTSPDGRLCALPSPAASLSRSLRLLLSLPPRSSHSHYPSTQPRACGRRCALVHSRAIRPLPNVGNSVSSAGNNAILQAFGWRQALLVSWKASASRSSEL